MNDEARCDEYHQANKPENALNAIPLLSILPILATCGRSGSWRLHSLCLGIRCFKHM